MRFVAPVRSLCRGRPHPLCATAFALLLSVNAPVAHDALAKAPPLATTVVDAEALAAPDHDAAPVTVICQGTEVELTCETAPGFLGVYNDDEAVWVPAQVLSLSDRPGIDTGVTVTVVDRYPVVRGAHA